MQQSTSHIIWQSVALCAMLVIALFMIWTRDYLLLIASFALGLSIMFLGIKTKANIRKNFVKAAQIIIVVTILATCIHEVMSHTNLYTLLSDKDNIRRVIRGSNAVGMIIYFALCLLQVVILPIPSVILVLVGTNIFGATTAFVLTTAATILGSMIAFFMGRKWGRKLVVWLIGDKAYKKYNKLVKSSGKYYLALMFLLPVFPDDILCMLAGISNISYKEFFVICVLTRPIMIAFTCYFGTGEIIPFSGWGIFVWIGIFAVFTLIFVLGKKVLNKNAIVDTKPVA